MKSDYARDHRVGRNTAWARTIVLAAPLLLGTGQIGDKLEGAANSNTATSNPTLKLEIRMVDSANSQSSGRFEYTLRNSGDPVRLWLDPTRFTIRVIAPGGSSLDPISAGYEPPSLGNAPAVTIPSGGFIGRRVDLTCVRSGYSSLSSTGCDYSFQLQPRTEYKIAVRYRVGISRPQIHARYLESDTISFTYNSH